MKASLPELEAVATIARLGGFRPAARALNVSSSALSHAVAALESRLGVRLFNRTTRSVALTAAGEAFVADIAPALAAIDGAVERVRESQAQPTGMLRLNTSLGAARLLLEPLLLEYLRRYPGMSLELVTEGALIDITGQGFDAGFRLAEAVPPDMIAGGEHYALEVKGDSMIEAGIFDGDTVIIRNANTASPGEIVVALVDEEEATLKRFRRKGASIALEAANPAYETRIFGPDRIKVQGRLVGLIRRY